MTVLIIAIAAILLSVKVILRKNGSFTSQHIHDSQAMRDRGIHCVQSMDAFERREKKHAKELLGKTR